MAQHSWKQTRHFATRMQQRGIRNSLVDIILAYGTCRRKYGIDTFYMDKPARQRARRELDSKSYAVLEKQMNVIIIASEQGALITIVHNQRR